MNQEQPDQQWIRASKGNRVLERDSKRRICHRVPVWAVHLHGYNLIGWFGWDPLNERWVSGPYGLPFAYASGLREALEFIDWHKDRRAPETVDWLKLYPRNSTVFRLSSANRRFVAQLITPLSLATRATRSTPKP